MNGFGSLAHGYRCYEYHRVVDDMNDSKLRAQCFRCYEQLRVVDDMNDSMS